MIKKQVGKYKCEKCGKEISLIAKTRHDRSCDGSYKNYKTLHYNVKICPFCNKEYSTASGCGSHISQCELNPDRIFRKTNYSWNKGKTKHTDNRLLLSSEKMSSKYKNNELLPMGYCSKSYHGSEQHRKNSSKGGGYRENAGRSKKFRVNDSFGNGVVLQSSYELRCSEILNGLNIDWIRPKYLKWDDGSRKYFADFYLPKYDIYLDPKNNYKSKLDEEKINSVIKENSVKVYIISEEQLTAEYITTLVSPNGEGLS